jgi:DNA-binding transcriptional MerR regulator
MTGSAASRDLSGADTGEAATPGPGVLYGIGQVLNLLRPEFADVTISKLRFLEAEGLVHPIRTPAGYRKYTPTHVARLRLVLTAQRDRYLPLRVIREQLRAAEYVDRVPGLAAPTAAPEPPGEVRLTRDQLRERSGLDDAGLADLEQYGLVVPEPAGSFGPEALAVASIAARLSGYGLAARHLRPHRATADREVGLLAQLVPPLSKQGGRGDPAAHGTARPDGRARAVQTVNELAALCAQLHGALVRQGLRSVLGA